MGSRDSGTCVLLPHSSWIQGLWWCWLTWQCAASQGASLPVVDWDLKSPSCRSLAQALLKVVESLTHKTVSHVDLAETSSHPASNTFESPIFAFHGLHPSLWGRKSSRDMYMQSPHLTLLDHVPHTPEFPGPLTLNYVQVLHQHLSRVHLPNGSHGPVCTPSLERQLKCDLLAEVGIGKQSSYMQAGQYTHTHTYTHAGSFIGQDRAGVGNEREQATARARGHLFCITRSPQFLNSDQTF